MASRTRFHLAASRVHKWLALVIGAQLLIWFASGAIMSFLPIDKLHGDHLVSRNDVQSITAGTPLTSPERIIAQVGAPVETMTWHVVGGRAVVELTTAKGVKMFDAASGNALPAVDAPLAMRIARAAWKSPEKPESTATLITQESPEYRAALPAWRIAFADSDQTSVFVARDTGRITAVRTETWRLYDFFWGLHIMDWQNHENFNTWWLLGFAIGGLLLGLAGIALLMFRWPMRPKRRRA